MPIFAEAQERLFRIRTAHTEYQMCADSYGVLKHLWYGVPVGHSMDYLRKYPDVGFAGNLYEAGNDRTYSLNTLPQEYAGAGVGDYRISAANVRHADGSQALDLRYQSYAIKPGKYSIPGLPAVYADAADAETLEITLRDAASGVEVVLQYGVLPELDIITRSAVFRNTGASPVVLQKQPACVWTCRTAHGSGCTSTVDTPWSGCRSGQRCSTACRRAPAQEALPAISRTPLRFCVRRTAQSRTAAASAHF